MPLSANRVLVLAILSVAYAGSTIQAQDASASPRRWAVEGTVSNGGGASLLRFFSPRTALRVGFSGDWDRQVGAASDAESYFLSGYAGLRRFSTASLGMRALWGGGFEGILSEYGSTHQHFLGAYAEGGAEYAFTPRVSAGAVSTLQFLHARRTSNGSGSTTPAMWRASWDLVRMTVTLRF